MPPCGACQVTQSQSNIKSITSDFSSRTMQFYEILIKGRPDRAQRIEAATVQAERDNGRARVSRGLRLVSLHYYLSCYIMVTSWYSVQLEMHSHRKKLPRSSLSLSLQEVISGDSLQTCTSAWRTYVSASAVAEFINARIAGCNVHCSEPWG